MNEQRPESQDRDFLKHLKERRRQLGLGGLATAVDRLSRPLESDDSPPPSPTLTGGANG